MLYVCPPSELFYTERAHLRTLKVLDCVFYQRLNRDGVLPPEDIKHIFINLEEIIQLHGNDIHTHYYYCIINVFLAVYDVLILNIKEFRLQKV